MAINTPLTVISGAFDLNHNNRVLLAVYPHLFQVAVQKWDSFDNVAASDPYVKVATISAVKRAADINVLTAKGFVDNMIRIGILC